MQTSNSDSPHREPSQIPAFEPERNASISVPADIACERASKVGSQAAMVHPGEIFLHWLFIAMSISVLALSFWLRYEEKSGVSVPGMSRSMPPLCTSRILLGMDCPGCGLTRAFIAISGGRFDKAWELNRVSFLVYAFVAAQIPWHSIQLIRIYMGKPPMFWSVIYMVPMTLAVVLVVNWMFKILGW